MRTDFTDITIVVDRSGSMTSIREDAQGGVNTFITEQAAAPGEAVLTLVQFDTEYEFVHRAVPVKAVPSYELVPRGMTALLDAVGRSIAEAGKRLARMEEAQRPGLVAFVIVTDGHENSSREFRLEQVREMITHQREKYGWQFTFLGADDSAFAQGRSLGLADGDIARWAKDKSWRAQQIASAKLRRSRAAAAAGESPAASFTDEERQQMS